LINYDGGVSNQLGLAEGYWARTRFGTPDVYWLLFEKRLKTISLIVLSPSRNKCPCSAILDTIVYLFSTYLPTVNWQPDKHRVTNSKWPTISSFTPAETWYCAENWFRSSQYLNRTTGGRNICLHSCRKVGSGKLLLRRFSALYHRDCKKMFVDVSITVKDVVHLLSKVRA